MDALPIFEESTDKKYKSKTDGKMLLADMMVHYNVVGAAYFMKLKF